MGNAIAGNSGPGVWIDPTASDNNQVVGNVEFFNGGLAIDLGLEGPTANAGSESSGPNFMLHKPVLTSTIDAGSNSVQVTGTVTTAIPNTGRLLTLYADIACGDAQAMLQTVSVGSGPDSVAHFSVTVPLPTPSSNLIYITATDETPYTGPTLTSEISNTRMIKPHDDIFYDDFDCY
jgi:hypothetical protein